MDSRGHITFFSTTGRVKNGLWAYDVLPGLEKIIRLPRQGEKALINERLLAAMFRKNVLLVAPLANLEMVKGNSGTIFCLPISLKGTSGAPARVVFEEDAGR